MYSCETEFSIVWYTDYMTILDEIKPKLVSFASESDIHAEITLACASFIIGLTSGSYLWKNLVRQ